jgi:hypothetical protein
MKLNIADCIFTRDSRLSARGRGRRELMSGARRRERRGTLDVAEPSRAVSRIRWVVEYPAALPPGLPFLANSSSVAAMANITPTPKVSLNRLVSSTS